MKKIALISIGAMCLLIAIYYLFTSINGTMALVSNDFNENEKGQLSLLLVINFFVVLLFGIIGSFTLKKGIKD
ncbi:MAG: hypothetical protein RIG77_20410 [Cyclobacteriaceae bacterium]